MKPDARLFRPVAAACCGALIAVAAISVTPTASAQELFFAKGSILEFEDQGMSGVPQQFQNWLRENSCDYSFNEDGLRGSIIDIVTTVLFKRAIENGMSEEAQAEFRDEWRAFEKEYCYGDDGMIDIPDFNIFYATCRMTMFQESMMLDIRLEPGSLDGVMDIVDLASGEWMSANLSRTLSRAESAIQTGMELNSLNPEPGQREIIGFTARPYSYDFSAEISIFAQFFGGDPDAAAQLNQLGAAAMPVIRSTGTAWIARDVPGYDIVRAFYENFSVLVQSGSGGDALLGGMFNHQLLSEGLPLETRETSMMTMMGMTMTNQETWTFIEGTLVMPMPEGYCDGSFAPESLTPTSITPAGPAQTSTAPTEATTSSTAPAGPQGGAGSAASPAAAAGAAAAAAAAGASAAGVPGAQQMPDLQGAMSAANQAMQDMTPEQQAQMQALTAGFGQLFGGLAANEAAVAGGGANPDAQAAAMQGVGEGLAGILGGLDGGQGNFEVRRNGAGPGAPAPASARPSAASLMTDNLTQTAQNMLRALGYDPGEANGELSTATAIAISQFQAERGLEVTGAVTPQLVGILAAAVDSP